MGPNYTHFENARFDEFYHLIEAGEGNQNGASREQYIQQANQILIDQAPVIPLYYDKSIRLIQPWVEGLQNDAANRLVLKRVKIKN
jgi:peptide/nickel transport system substrate-binding protein